MTTATSQENGASENPSEDAVVDGALATRVQYPNLLKEVTANRINRSVRVNWPNVPPPLSFWLWMAGTDLTGRFGASECLLGLETILEIAKQDRWITGSWRSRFKKLIPPSKQAGFDHYSNFRGALFELNLAARLINATVIEVRPDGQAPACDLWVRRSGRVLVEVEALAPEKGLRQQYESELVQDWRALVIGGPPDTNARPDASQSGVRRITRDPEAMIKAVRNLIMTSNFSSKLAQLSSATHPALLAIRAYGVTADLTDVLVTPSGQILSDALSPDVWSQLPRECYGLIVCFQGDALKLASPMLFVPSPQARLDDVSWDYLASLGAIDSHLLHSRPRMTRH